MSVNIDQKSSTEGSIDSEDHLFESGMITSIDCNGLRMIERRFIHLSIEIHRLATTFANDQERSIVPSSRQFLGHILCKLISECVLDESGLARSSVSAGIVVEPRTSFSIGSCSSSTSSGSSLGQSRRKKTSPMRSRENEVDIAMQMTGRRRAITSRPWQGEEREERAESETSKLLLFE